MAKFNVLLTSNDKKKDLFVNKVHRVHKIAIGICIGVIAWLSILTYIVLNK